MSSKKSLRALVRMICENEMQQYDSDLIDIVNLWINDPRSLDNRAHSILKQFVSRQQLPRATRLERIERIAPEWRAGIGVELDLRSFSTLRFSEDQRSSNIAWKTSDQAIVMIENATRGWAVDYNIVNAKFSAASEREVLITGRYLCTRVERIVEPGTYPQYDYRVPMYVLKEH